jgi:hypothetical protein
VGTVYSASRGSVDGERDEADPCDHEELDAGGHRDGCGIAADVGLPGVGQFPHLLERRAVGDHPEIGLGVGIAQHEVDEQRGQSRHGHEGTRRCRAPGQLGGADDAQHGERRREEPAAREERATETE